MNILHVKIFVSQGNYHLGESSRGGTLKNQVEKTTRPVEVSHFNPQPPQNDAVESLTE